MYINDESYERMQTAIDDIKAGCEVMDDFNEWEDIASSSISRVLEELNSEQTEMTCAAFRKFVSENIGTNRNFSLGVRAALIRALDEMLDFLGEPYEPDEDEEDRESYNEEVSYRETLRKELDITKEMEV